MVSARRELNITSSCDPSKAPSPVAFDTVTDYLCSLKLKLRRHEGADVKVFDEVDFGRSGLLHSKALAARTVPGGRFNDLHLVRSHIKYMRPTIIHIVAHNEPVGIGSQFAKVANTASRYLDIYHDRLRIFINIDVPVWVIRTQPKINDRDLRDLCLYLRRLHSEYECIKRLLIEIDRGNVKVADGLLPKDFEEYLRDFLKRVRSAENKLLRAGRFAPSNPPDNPSIVELASISIHDLDPSLYSKIQIALKRLRFNWTSNEKQINGFIEQLQNRSATINVNVSELNMDNRQTVSNSSNVVLAQAGRDAQVSLDRSFNGFQENTSNTELVQAIADLKEILDQAIEAGEVDNPESAARDFAELADEASSKKPRKEKIEFSGKMLIGAIKESSSLISSVRKAIEVLRELF